MTRARVAVATQALVLALIAAGCGDEQPVEVFRDDVVQRRDVERYPPGDPARTLVQLTRVLQSNDPTAIVEHLTPEWRLTPDKVAEAIPELGTEAQRFGVPKVLRVRRRAGVATIDASWGPWRARVTLHSTGGTWRVGRVNVNGRRLQFSKVRSP
jgi:hypothetical protein